MRVLIIEDDPDMAGFLDQHLPERGFVVDLAGTGGAGLLLAAQNQYDLIVLDLHLPDMSGEVVIEKIHARERIPPILMLTVMDNPETKTRLLWAGADDYLSKPFSFEELVARMRALLRRSSEVTPDTLQIGDLMLDIRMRTVTRGVTPVGLTAKEFLVLEYLMRNRGSVVSKDMLIEHIWNASVNPFSNAIEMHLVNLRKKLGTPVLIRTEHGRGYVIG